MQINTNSICNDLLAISLEDSVLDLSWAIDTDTLKQLLNHYDVIKIINFNQNIDFKLQIDNVETFDSINLKEYTFSQLKQTYRGNIVYSAIIDFNKNKFEETTYYFRVKLSPVDTSYNIKTSEEEKVTGIIFNDTWSKTHKFIIDKNYTKDLVETMYNMVVDFNAYNKEAKSANMYYIFQAIADVLNKEFKLTIDEKNKKFINKSLPDYLSETFGVLFKFSNTENISMEEYRRILRSLIIAYQHGGAWNYIKEVLKYLLGQTPELYTLKNFYPWILRSSAIPDPQRFSDRNYYNPESNYYLFSSSFGQTKNKNSIMLMNSYDKLFTFIVKSDNFFNVNVDKNKICAILDLLKSVYTKYSLNLDISVSPSVDERYLLVDDDTIFLVDEDNYIRY